MKILNDDLKTNQDELQKLKEDLQKTKEIYEGDPVFFRIAKNWMFIEEILCIVEGQSPATLFAK